MKNTKIWVLKKEYKNDCINDFMYSKVEKMFPKIHAFCRGYHLRKQLKRLDDNYTFDLLNRCLDNYIANLQSNDDMNKELLHKKIRNPNFPSDISENIAKFAIFKKYGIMPCWDNPKGDIVIKKNNIFKQIEVKGFMSKGPSSFGPTEAWDILYFIDGQDIKNKNFKVYEIKLSNKNEIFRNIPLSKGENYGDIADSGRRPRGCFYETFKPKLEDHCNLIFDGHISELDNLF